MDQTTADEIKDLRFEEAFAQLEEALDEMRQDGLALDRALALYERGVQLSVRCDQLLEKAELRVNQVTPGGAIGPYENEGTALGLNPNA